MTCDPRALAELRDIAEDLKDAEDALARRNRIWKEQRAKGCSPDVLAEASGVKAATIRQTFRRYKDS